MYPDLSYLFHDLFGTPPDNWTSLFKTFGLLLLLAFLSAAALLRSELRRRQAIGQLSGVETTILPRDTVTVYDYLFNGLLGFVLGYKLTYVLANLAEFQVDPTPILLSLKGYWWAGILGALALGGYYVYLGRRQGEVKPVKTTVYPSDRVGPITLMAALGGIVGAKIFAIWDEPASFLADPVGVLLSGSGLAIYGGLIGGALFVVYYLRKHGIPILPVTDAVAPALFVAYGVGRIGCQLSGDGDWGNPAGPQPAGWFLPDWLWSYDFPHNVAEKGVLMAGCDLEYCHRLAEAVYPTSVYETLMAFTMGGILWVLRKPLTSLPGLLFSIYLFLNGVERFFIEFARINDLKNFLGFQLTQAQIIALGFMLGGILLGIWSYRHHRSQHL